MIRILRMAGRHLGGADRILKIDGREYRIGVTDNSEVVNGVVGPTRYIISMATVVPPSETILISKRRFPTFQEAEKAMATEFPIPEEAECNDRQAKAIEALVGQWQCVVVLGDSRSWPAAGPQS